MKKAEFLQILRNKISNLPEIEIEKALHFYEETISDRIEDGFSEDEAVAALGNIDDIVVEMKMDQPLSTLMSNKLKETVVQTSRNKLWIVLVLVGLPIWLPLLISLALIVFSLLITMWALVIILGVFLLVLGIAVIACVIGAVVEFVRFNLLQGTLFVGMSLISLGLFLIAIPLLRLVLESVKTGTLKIANKLKSALLRKAAMR